MSGRTKGPPPAGGTTGSGASQAPTDDAYYRTLFDSMMEGFAHCRMVYDAEGRPDDWVYLSVNPAFARLTGIEGAAGRRVTEVLPAVKDETPELLEVCGRVVATGEPAEFDIDVTPLGKWLHVSATRPREGEFVALFYDVTERVAATRAAELAVGVLRRSLTAAGAGVWEWDLRTNQNTWSEELWRLYDLDPGRQEAGYDAWLESVHPDDRETAVASVNGSAAEGREIDIEYRVNMHDGSTRWIISRGSPERDDEGHVVRYLGVVVDVTQRKLATLEQKRAEAAILEERAKLDAALRSTMDAVYISDADGNFIDFNDAFVTFHRFASREECATSLRDYPGLTEVFHADGRPAPFDEWAVSRALRGEAASDVEYTVRRTDTGESWVGSFSFAPIRDRSDHIVGSIVVGRDITERKRMEEDLRESEAAARETVERLSRAQQLGHMGDWEWDVTTGEVRWSAEVYRIYGVPVDFVTSFDTITPLIHPDDRGEDLRRAQEILDDPACASGALQFRIVRPDGAVRHIHQTLAVERDAEGRALRMFGIMQDVTEVREAESARLESERRFRRIYDAGLVGVVFWTAEGGITDANDRFLEMLGYSRAELEAGEVGWAGITPPEWAERDQESLEELRTIGRNAVPFAKEYCRKDGSRLPILTAAAALDDAGQTGIALVVDISEQKRAEEDLRRFNLKLEDRVRQRTADLEAANAELESFSYSVSHDLRAPLRHIAGFSELLRDRLSEVRDGEARHFIDVITRSVVDMSTLIDDLLRFSRVGRAEMHVEQVDMAALVEEVLEVEREELGERRLDVTVGELPPAAGDRTLLRQVWVNLLDNAVKYTRPRETATVDVGAREEGSQTVYWVRDNGVGFEMQYVDRLFRVFERLHRSDEFEGTGIGLANVGRIVGRHGGRCWAEAAENAGATFYFSLPRAG